MIIFFCVFKVHRRMDMYCSRRLWYDLALVEMEEELYLGFEQDFLVSFLIFGQSSSADVIQSIFLTI